MSRSSPEALYHSIPQNPPLATPQTDESTLNLDADFDDEEAVEELVQPIVAVPVDSRIRWINFVLGCAVLLPWNALITAIPYFLSRLAGSHLQSTFTSYLSITFTLANFLCLAHATATSKQTAPSVRTTTSLYGLTALTFLLTLSTFISISPGFFFIFVLLNGIIQASFGSYLQSSVIAVASLFGPQAVQAMLAGQAAVAVVVSAVQVVSAAVSVKTATMAEFKSELTGRGERDPEERSAFIFFGLSTIFLLLSLAAHRWLISMPEYRTVVGPLEVRKQGAGTTRTTIFDPPEVGTNVDEQSRILISAGPSQFLTQKHRIWRVAKANVLYEIAVAYVFTVTLTVFPPITSSILPTNTFIHPLLFTSMHFLVFGLGDFFGRYICAFPRVLIWSAKRLLALSLSRTLFIFLFLMCNIQRPTNPSMNLSNSPPPIINSDFLFMLILFLFGLSNGYVASLCMMSAPSLEHNPRLKGKKEDVDVAATVSQFCLIGGLVLGSMASFVVRGAVCGCNPFVM
ncbi:nucleoside transporter-domain-containing protein [Lentinula aff. detonsa]|uniref:Nucleoside transporter-domain-containing protein n=1 Tax=Lentinula aff. detonsa TaxID=2804958 RepID=A0AA38U0S1_9AGAR|nr:nucleoside transporter-domain-containing protein [Lentinula aff. detonsa]